MPRKHLEPSFAPINTEARSPAQFVNKSQSSNVRCSISRAPSRSESHGRDPLESASTAEGEYEAPRLMPALTRTSKMAC
eukprot:12398798-Karenia_brevis.AAC.1